MHAAKLDNSQRLQRVLAVLADGEPHSTYEILHAAQVCAVNSIVAELRANGHAIHCHREGGRWWYQLEAPQ